jgi:hypothetical protein
MFFAGLPPGYVPPGALVWASFLGGTALDQANTIALDAAGDVWSTASLSRPIFRPLMHFRAAVNSW